MREASSELRAILAAGGFVRTWVADLIYDGVRREQGLKLLNPDFSWDGNAQIQASGSCEIVADALFGRGIVPREIGDVFSPFGAELQVDLVITAGAFRERIPMGRFVLESVPEAVERSIPGAAGGTDVVIESRVKLELRDFFLRVKRDRFPFPTAPASTSMWDEVFALTGLPVLRNVSDVTIPTSVTYEDDKLQALDDLFAVVDAWPHLTPAGQVTARPKEWPTQVDEFAGVLSAPRVMESEKVYNRVVVEGKDPEGGVIRAIAEIGSGFLRVRNTDGSRSPFGVSTYRYQSDFLTTQDQCDATAASMLTRVSRLRSVTRTVTEPLMPLREVGDVIALEGAPSRILSVAHDATTTTSVVEVNP